MKRTMTAAALVAAAMLAGPAAVPVRAEVGPGTYAYTINHSKYGTIGTYTIKLAKQGAQTIVDSAIDIKVKIVLITAHRENGQRKEVWQGGKMVGFSSTTKENDKRFKVTAKAAGDKLMVNSTSGSTSVPLGVWPSNPWNKGILKAKTLLDTKTGQIKKVIKVALGGEEVVKMKSGTVKAMKYLFQDDQKRFLWYDASGRLVKFRVFRDGDMVTFTLK